MANYSEKKDKHFPLIAHKIARLSEPPKVFIEPYVSKGQVVADLGCGPGFYSLHFAKILGLEGKIYTVASDLHFIKEESVDFIFANGLLCSMAPREHESSNPMEKNTLALPGDCTVIWKKMNGMKYYPNSMLIPSIPHCASRLNLDCSGNRPCSHDPVRRFRCIDNHALIVSGELMGRGGDLVVVHIEYSYHRINRDFT